MTKKSFPTYKITVGGVALSLVMLFASQIKSCVERKIDEDTQEVIDEAVEKGIKQKKEREKNPPYQWTP